MPFPGVGPISGEPGFSWKELEGIDVKPKRSGGWTGSLRALAYVEDSEEATGPVMPLS